MYGKALCLYLQKKLPDSGIEVVCDDYKMGLCIYSQPDSRFKYSFIYVSRIPKFKYFLKLSCLDTVNSIYKLDNLK